MAEIDCSPFSGHKKKRRSLPLVVPLVGPSLDVMDRDARMMRKDKPFVFTNLKAGEGLQDNIRFIISEGMLPEINEAVTA